MKHHTPIIDNCFKQTVLDINDPSLKQLTGNCLFDAYGTRQLFEVCLYLADILAKPLADNTRTPAKPSAYSLGISWGVEKRPLFPFKWMPHFTEDCTYNKVRREVIAGMIKSALKKRDGATACLALSMANAYGYLHFQQMQVATLSLPDHQFVDDASSRHPMRPFSWDRANSSFPAKKPSGYKAFQVDQIGDKPLWFRRAICAIEIILGHVDGNPRIRHRDDNEVIVYLGDYDHDFRGISPHGVFRVGERDMSDLSIDPGNPDYFVSYTTLYIPSFSCGLGVHSAVLPFMTPDTWLDWWRGPVKDQACHHRFHVTSHLVSNFVAYGSPWSPRAKVAHDAA